MKTKTKSFLSKYNFILLLLLMVIIFHHPVLKSFSKSELPFRCPPDTNLILTIIEWNMHCFVHNLPGIYHLNTYYPNAYTTFYSHPLFGESLIFLIFHKFLGFDITKSYSLYLLFAFWIGALGTFLLARELTRNRFIPLLAALVFILYPFSRNSFSHLHSFSFFWAAFVFYYLIRFRRKGKLKDAILAGMFIFLQGLFSIYHGYFLITIFLPVFFLLSVLFKFISFKNACKLAGIILIFIILLVVVCHPFLTSIKHSGLERTLDYQSLIDVENILGSNPIFPQQIWVNLFPGFSVIILVLFTLIGIDRKKIITISILITALLLVCFLNMKNYAVPSNWIFFLVIASSIAILILKFRELETEVKIFFITLFFFLILFYKYSSLIPGSDFSVYGLLVKVVPALSNLRYFYRGVLILIPILAVLAAYGLLKLWQLGGKKRIFLTFLFLSLIVIENGYLKNKSTGNFQFRPSKYRKIEKNSDKIILELPIFDHRTHNFFNNRYTINTIFHYNYYVNGRTAYRVHKDNTWVLNKTLKNKNFPDENSLLWLMQNYSVDYIIFNWRPKLEQLKKDILARLSATKNLYQIVDRTPDFLVIRLMESYPVKEILRKYSYFHLKNRKLSIELKKPYKGKISLIVPEKRKRKEFNQLTDQTGIVMDFPEMTPKLDGTFIRVVFEEQVEIKEIKLVK